MRKEIDNDTFLTNIGLKQDKNKFTIKKQQSANKPINIDNLDNIVTNKQSSFPELKSKETGKIKEKASIKKEEQFKFEERNYEKRRVVSNELILKHTKYNTSTYIIFIIILSYAKIIIFLYIIDLYTIDLYPIYREKLILRKYYFCLLLLNTILIFLFNQE